MSVNANSYISLEHDARFVIYGAGEVGGDCFKALKGSGYEVSFALDKLRAGEDLIGGVMTYKLGEEPIKDKDEFVVIICLANGLIHREVADQLYQNGYRYIIFLPIGCCLKDEYRRSLTRDYNYALAGDIADKGINVVNYESLIKPDLDASNSILRIYDDEYIIWCGIEMLHTESLELWNGDKSKLNTRNEYRDKNISINNPCRKLFDYLAGDIESADEYYESKKKVPAKEALRKDLLSREALYKVFEDELNKGMDFFIEGAPRAIWNPNSYWNLVGGHHRTSYLLHKKHTLFPIRVSKREFGEWCNEDAYKDLRTYINDKGVDELYAPFPHPGFLNFPARYENMGDTSLEAILCDLYRNNQEDITSLRVLDTLDDEGYFARIMDRIGVEHSCFYNIKERQRELTELCNRVLYRDKVIILDEEPGRDSFDVVICKDEEIKKYKALSGLIIYEECFSESLSGTEKWLFKEYINNAYHGFRVHRLDVVRR